MARKEGKDKGKDGDEEYEFVPPDFDEEKFIHKEMISFRTTAVLFGWGIVAALVSFLLFGPVGGVPSGWWIGLLAMAFLGLGLKRLFATLKIDISHWGKKEWFGTAFLYFFTWIAFFILFLNPPISDQAPPEVLIHLSPGAQEAGGDMDIHVIYIDNHRLDRTFFELRDPDDEVLAERADLAARDDIQFEYVAQQLRPGTYTWIANATDAAGHTTFKNGSFEVHEEALRTTVRDLERPGESIDVHIRDMDLFAVYLQMDRPDCDRMFARPLDAVEARCRVYLSNDPLLDDGEMRGWKATSASAGWSLGANTFFTVAEGRNAFAHQHLLPGGELRDGPFTVNVTASIGDHTAPVPPAADPTEPPTRQIPAPAPLVLVAGLVALAVLRRRVE